MTRVVHVTTGLGVGGAELVMTRLVMAMQVQGVDSQIVSLTGDGPVGQRLRASGVEVLPLSLRGARAPAAIPALVAAISRRRPDVVQTWMYHADLLGGLAARAAGVPALVWNLRMTESAAGVERARTRALVGLNARLSSRLPDVVVACSEATRAVHLDLGYAADKLRTIPNGFAVPALVPGWAEARARLGLPVDGTVVGRVGRWHPMKDYPTFLAAAAQVAAAEPEVRFLLVGDGLEAGQEGAESLVRAHGLEGRVVLAGVREDMATAYASMDVLCSSSSSGEGFPNVLGEAMAHGVPVVATDVGESAAIVGSCGEIVRPRQARSLADALLRVLRLPEAERRRLGMASRERIAERYSLEQMVSSYRSLYEELADVRHRRRR